MPPRPAQTTAVLLSVRPRFAASLLDGSKTVEIRRGRAHLQPGATCLLYSSSPERALVGTVRVASTHVALPSVIWAQWGPATGLDRAEFDAYLSESNEATAIVVEGAQRFKTAIPLEELRDRQQGFVTPQSYRFVAEQERQSLLGLRRDRPAFRLAPAIVR